MALDETTEEVEAPQSGDAEPSLRDTINQSIEKLESPADPVAAKGDGKSLPDGAPVLGKKIEGRDDRGRFAPKPAASKMGTQAAAPAGPPATGQQPPAAPAAELKPPQSWKANVREKWAQLPPEVQQEVLRRESETARALQESAEPRKFAQAFQQVVNPYMAMIQAEGSNPLRAVGNLLQTAAALRMAPPAHKGVIVANLIKQFGIDLDHINSALGGEAPQGQQQQPMSDPRVDQLLMELQQAKQMRMQAVEQKTQTEIEEFAKSHEFFDDVHETMADILEVAGRRKQAMSYEEAYERAVVLHPEVYQLYQQRKEAQRAAQAAPGAQRAKAAASSIRGSPTGSVHKPQSGVSLRDDIEAALKEVNQR